jgi:transcriptional regulator with XRE-family HTH domain
MVSNTLGGRIEQARTALGWTPRQLATRAGVKPSTIENWERDRSEPRSNKLVMLAGILNVPVLWMLEGDSRLRPDQPKVVFSETRTIAQKLNRAVAMQQELATLLIELSADITRLQRELDAEDDLAAA